MAAPVIAPVIAAGIGAAASLYGSSKAKKSADSAMRQQQDMFQQDLAWRKMLYDHYQNVYGPIEQQMAKEALSTEPLGYAQQAQAIETQAGEARRSLGESMAQRGLSGSGLDVGSLAGLAAAEVGAKSKAYAEGIDRRRNLAMGMLAKDPSVALGQNVSGGFGRLGDLYGQYGQLYNQATLGGYQAAGQALSGIASYLASRPEAPAGSKLPAPETVPVPQPQLQPEMPIGMGARNAPMRVAPQQIQPDVQQFYSQRMSPFGLGYNPYKVTR